MTLTLEGLRDGLYLLVSAGTVVCLFYAIFSKPEPGAGNSRANEERNEGATVSLRGRTEGSIPSTGANLKEP